LNKYVQLVYIGD